MVKNYLPAILIIACLSACNHSPNPANSTAASAGVDSTATSNSTTNSSATPVSNSTAKGGKVLKFKPASIIDQQGTGTEAINLLIPSDWTMQSRVTWNLDNNVYPATATLQATDPTGKLQFEYFPTGHFYYPLRPMMGGFKPGMQYMGYTITSEIPDASKAMTRYLIPAVRGNVQGLKIIEEKVLIPETRSNIAGGVTIIQKGMLERVEYTLNGTLYEENIYAVYGYSTKPGRDFVFWEVSHAYGFRAPKGQLAGNMKVFETMLNSIQFNQHWYNKYVQFAQMLTQRRIQSIKRVGEISKMMAQTSDQISAERRQAFESHMQSTEAVNDKFCDYLLDVNAYHDPETKQTYKLPAGYSYAWKSSNGEYIMSDQPGYNPNQSSTNSTWTQLEENK